MACDRGRIDDVSGFAVGSHMRQEDVKAVYDADDIDLEKPFPVPSSSLFEWGDGEGAGVVHEEVNGPQRGARLLQGLGEALLAGDIAVDRDRVRARCLEFLAGLLRRFGVDVRDRDGDAFSCEALGDGAPNAVGPASDEGRFSLKFPHCLCLRDWDGRLAQALGGMISVRVLSIRSPEPMYAVRHFSQVSMPVMRAYLVENPFATLVVNTADGPSVEHLPMAWDGSSDREGRLLGHIARSNPLWREFESAPGLAVFSGHDAYVSPDWYSTKAVDPRVVPTWNYAAVHVSGTLRFFHDADRILELLTRLTDRFESGRPTPWQPADAPDEYLDRMVGAVVGVELEIERVVGKWKLSQNRPREDREGVMAGLRREAGARGAALADLMAVQDGAKAGGRVRSG